MPTNLNINFGEPPSQKEITKIKERVRKETVDIGREYKEMNTKLLGQLTRPQRENKIDKLKWAIRK